MKDTLSKIILIIILTMLMAVSAYAQSPPVVSGASVAEIACGTIPPTMLATVCKVEIVISRAYAHSMPVR